MLLISLFCKTEECTKLRPFSNLSKVFTQLLKFLVSSFLPLLLALVCIMIKLMLAVFSQLLYSD